jgi:hypothetical protein
MLQLRRVAMQICSVAPENDEEWAEDAGKNPLELLGQTLAGAMP